MNDDLSPSVETGLHRDAFLPVLLLALSYLALLIWNISSLTTQRHALEDAGVQQEQLITQSHNAQAGLQKLVSDLFEVAQTDASAKAIVAKYGVQVHGAAPGASPAP